MDLTDKVCVVTGAARGIGFSLAKQLLVAGAKVMISDADEKALQEAVKSLSSDRVSAWKTDVRSESDISALAENAESQLGPIAVWINNAGVARHKLITEYTEDDIDWMMDVNYKGTVLGCKYALRTMKDQRAGHIINIISTAGLTGVPTESVYCGTKFAVRGFTQALQEEAAQFDIRVSGIYPGGVNTAFWDTAREQKSPVEKYLTPEDVAKAIVSVIEMDDNCVTHEIVLRSMKDANFNLQELNQ
ncbi:SDR family NAD(P)-dependent oxidoreductase [Paenibacillus sp. LMG 31460]|uniref:SDR family NAD(P)-dependent oxidoreductase n=1 Tax=Paenibacillus germinis TaxID=2654979 RepID=A0ABX1Z644_9BACL|nr:SDR family oxidoreductase [Paenibacillus germinis]NOU88747.1 SDR family NAD(P)-dependent oxidoreductase [Paenibacillus germinis]